MAFVPDGSVSHPHALAAMCFVAFWMVSQDKAQSSWSCYLYRSIPVVIYFVLTMGDHGLRLTVIEWLASWMVFYHFFSVIFVIGDSMKRGLNGTPRQ